MKGIKFLIFTICVMCVNSSVLAATVWAPTDGEDDDFYFSSTTENTTSGMLAIFDNSDQSLSGPKFVLLDFDSVKFTPTAGGFSVVSMQNKDSAPFFLSETFNFILGFSVDGGNTWSGDTNTISLGSNIHQVIFGDLSVTAIDVAAVPLPAAIWLFGTAFLGLIGFSHRKNRKTLNNRCVT